MKSPIVKTFIGKHIDLSKIVAISDAEFIDRMGNGGYYVGFKIHIQLMDKPIEYMRKITYQEEEQDFGKWPDRKRYCESDFIHRKPIAVVNLQRQVDELIRQWKAIY